MARPITPIAWEVCTSANCLITALYDWQTLVGALIALGAAIWAGNYVRAQINQAERLDYDRRQQRFIAARSTLPLTLSSMSSYATNMGARLKTYHQHIVNENLHGLLFEPISPPADAIAALERMIEASDIASLNLMIRKMLSEVQLLQARAEELARPNLGDRVGIPPNIETYILQCAVIYAQAAALFDFARFSSDSPPDHVEWASAYNALSVIGVRAPEFPGLFQFMQHIEANGRGPESP